MQDYMPNYLSRYLICTEINYAIMVSFPTNIPNNNIACKMEIKGSNIGYIYWFIENEQAENSSSNKKLQRLIVLTT